MDVVGDPASFVSDTVTGELVSSTEAENKDDGSKDYTAEEDKMLLGKI